MAAGCSPETQETNIYTYIHKLFSDRDAANPAGNGGEWKIYTESHANISSPRFSLRLYLFNVYNPHLLAFRVSL